MTGYRLLVFKADRRTKDGWRLVETKEYLGFSGTAMTEEIASLKWTVYPPPRFYLDFEPLTAMVKNLMTGAMVEIDYREVGGPCDPSTERYWSM